jgi:hypothetical protein
LPVRSAPESKRESARETSPDLEGLLERRSTPRLPGHSFAPVDELRKEEAELKRPKQNSNAGGRKRGRHERAEEPNGVPLKRRAAN